MLLSFTGQEAEKLQTNEKAILYDKGIDEIYPVVTVFPQERDELFCSHGGFRWKKAYGKSWAVLYQILERLT